MYCEPVVRRRRRVCCGRSVLTGGGGLSGIDVADNDHVDVHLFLTAQEEYVSRLPIKIEVIVAMMLLIEGGWLAGTGLAGRKKDWT